MSVTAPNLCPRHLIYSLADFSPSRKRKIHQHIHVLRVKSTLFSLKAKSRGPSKAYYLDINDLFFKILIWKVSTLILLLEKYYLIMPEMKSVECWKRKVDFKKCRN